MSSNKIYLDNEQVLIEDLRAGKDSAFEYVYRQYFKMIAQYIETNKGSRDDTQDVFQESLIILVKNIRKDGFILSSKVSTFLFAIAKRYWLYKLRGKKESSVDIDDLNTSHLVDDDSELLAANEYDVKHTIIGEVFQQLKDDCRQLLSQFYFNKIALGVVAKEMGWSDDFVKVKKKRCMESLKTLVQHHNSYQSLIK